MRMRQRFCRTIPTILVQSASVIVSSCGNDRTPVTATPPLGQSGQLSFTEQPQPSNEYDWFGVFHNRAMLYGIRYLADYEGIDLTTVGFMAADFLVDYNTTDSYTVTDIPSIGASCDTIFAEFYNWRNGRTVQQCIASLNTTRYVKAHILTMVNDIHTCQLPNC